jgi:hypothetical protein
VLMALHLALDECVDEMIFADDDPSSTRRAIDRARADSIRIVEQYRTRQIPAVLLGDPTGDAGPRQVQITKRWIPRQGRDELNRRYRLKVNAEQDFPVRDPGGATSASWRQFSQEVFGFVPSASMGDETRWQNFLARRYKNVAALNDAYGSNPYASFTLVPLPAQLPGDGWPLFDWYQFESVVMSMWNTAHQFSVLIPAPAQDTPDNAEHQRRLALAQRVVDLEKPAHTTFQVKFYWDVFQVGSARLGEDTLIDLGSRAPQFMASFVVGQSYLLEGHLTAGHPYNISESDRTVIGRDRLTH